MSYFMKDSIKTHAVSANRNNAYADLARRVRSGEFKIAVYGLGHVGSPLVSTWLRAGAHLIGVDNSSEAVSYTHLTLPTNREV